MSLDKAIAHHHEHRRPYQGPKAADPTCRNHGDCPVCSGNRLHTARLADERARDAVREWEEGEGGKDG